MVVPYDGRTQLLVKMTMMSPRVASPRRAPMMLMSPRARAADHALASPICGYSRADATSDIFDGRMTTPRLKRLQTATRSRRVEAPTGTTVGKDELGFSLPQRIHLRSLQSGALSASSPRYVNDAREGSAKLSYYDVVPPSNCPKGQTFSRLAVAIGRGGCFERSFAGCMPFSP
jgi:hypothetical protein